MATLVSSENICVSPTVARLLSDLAGILKQESSPLLDGLRGELEGLLGKFTAIQAMLQDAEQKQLSDQKVKDWLREIRESACDAEDVLDLLTTEAHLRDRDQVRNLEAPPAVSRPESCASKMRDLLDRLGHIDQAKEELRLERDRERERYHERRGRTTDISRFEDARFVVGRRDDKSNIMKLLLSDDTDNGNGGISVIPIIGMGGLGKTTLTHLVFNDREVAQRFDSRMWVCVTDDFDLKRILREMIQFHSKMPIDPNFSEDLLESRLLDFVEGLPFLLVLDDVWPEGCEEVWGKLKSILNKGGKASRVLITSRNENVRVFMGTQEPYNLECLPEAECLSLFNKIAFRGDGYFDDSRRELELIGKKIVEKCKGLPLAVKAMAGLLRGTEKVDKWRAILRSEIWEVEENGHGERAVRVLPALQLSYNHLPPYLKQCFAYCSIFPKAYVFQKRELVKLWMAEAFLQTRDDNKSPQEVGSEYFDELLVRSFFQTSNIDNKVVYRMHDLIHDMAMSISKPYCFLVKGTESGISKASRHASLFCRHAEKPLFEVIENSKKLRTLLFPTDYLKNFGQALDRLFHSLRYLRALDLSSSELQQLPDSIAELKLLRYLDLSKTEIRELPDSVCRLYNLETLKLLHCPWLYKLPEDLSGLVNLCHLELDDMFWFKATRLPPRMGNLTKLQNLHKFIVSKEMGEGIEELNRLACLGGTLRISELENARDAAEANLKEKPNLQKVVFEWSPTSELEHGEANHMSILEDLQPHTDLEEFQISYYKGSASPRWLRDGEFGNLVKVSLAHCANCRTLSIGQSHSLRELKLKGMEELETCLGQWPSLGRLNVNRCPKLRLLPSIFPNMRAMKIKRCDSLEVLPVTPVLQFLILDSNSSLEEWGEEQFFPYGPNEQEQDFVMQVHCLSCLLELTVIRCPKLEGLPKIFAPQKLEIRNCELIKRLPLPQFARRLKHLALVGCADDRLVRAIPCTASLFSLVISAVSNLSTFPEWPLLPGLNALYIHDCPDLESLSSENGGSLQVLASVTLLSVRNCPRLKELAMKGLPAELERLSIGSCPNLESLGPAGTLTSLSKLRDVYILDCPMLPMLPEDGFPKSVEHLHIENCPLLTARCYEENGGGPDWPKIKDIPDLEISDLNVPTAPCHPLAG